MLIEILNPQGDPYAEPQVMLMSALITKGTMRQLANDIEEIAQRTNRMTEHEAAKSRRYIHRFMLLLALVMKFCPDQIQSSLNLSILTQHIDSAVSSLDPDCMDKTLTMEFLKYLKKIVASQDESISRSLLDARHFLTILGKFHTRNNIISSQMGAIIEELKKMHCFKLHQLFIEANTEKLEEMREASLSLKGLFSHYEWIKKSARAGENQKGSEGKDGVPLSSPGSKKMSDMAVPEEDTSTSREHLAQLATIFRNKKSAEENDEDSEDIFFGMKYQDRLGAEDNSPSGSASPGAKSTSSVQKIEFSLKLDKRDPFDDNDDDFEGVYGNPSRPNKQSETILNTQPSSTL